MDWAAHPKSFLEISGEKSGIQAFLLRDLRFTGFFVVNLQT